MKKCADVPLAAAHLQLKGNRNRYQPVTVHFLKACFCVLTAARSIAYHLILPESLICLIVFGFPSRERDLLGIGSPR
jgi:hypothetical protein